MDSWVWLTTFLSCALLGGAGGLEEDLTPFIPATKAFEMDRFMTSESLAKRFGYPFEQYEVETEDGYILSVHRIPFSQKNKMMKGYRPPVLLQHGLFGSSDNWIVTGPGRAPALMLADLGYDVWIGNARGNTYSRDHKNLTRHDKNYWQFSWNEMGIYDLPAVIDHILKTTGEKSLLYTGHSMGSTMFFVMCSERPEYVTKVHTFVGLAPVAYWNYISTPIGSLLTTFGESILNILSRMGMNNILEKNDIMATLINRLCRSKITLELCVMVFHLTHGYSFREQKERNIPLILGMSFGGTSSQTINHFLQSINQGTFSKYNYESKNERIYFQKYPPSYDLSKTTMPTYLYYSVGDQIINYEAVLLLPDLIPNLKKFEKHRTKDFNHMDYIFDLNLTGIISDYSYFLKNIKLNKNIMR